MKSLYVTSVERFSGKTATCLALGKIFQGDGHSVGYLKPLSLQPWRIGGQMADEDAGFVIQMLNLPADPTDLSPVVVTPEFLEQQLTGSEPTPLLERVIEASRRAGAGKDVLLLEGGGSLREGYVFGLPTIEVAKALGSAVLAIVKFRGNVRVLDDALAAYNRLGESLLGVLINRVPDSAATYVSELARPFLERRGIPILGILPEVRGLAAITVAELIETLDAEVLTETHDSEALVENLTVGAMTADIALSRFRKQTNKAVITGGDRTDIQLAALETSTNCLVLTGNINPSPLIVKQANEFGVAILLVRPSTMEAIELIETRFGKTRLGQPSKVKMFQELLREHLDIPRLYKALDLP